MSKIGDRYHNWIRNMDGVQGFQIEHSYSARIGKHYCPYCHSLLQVKQKKQIVNSESEEAKNFDFSSGGEALIGNIEFKWDIFYCEHCNKEIPTGDIYQYERVLKKKGGYVNFDAFIKDRDSHPKKKRGRWTVFRIALLAVAVFAAILIITSIWF